MHMCGQLRMCRLQRHEVLRTEPRIIDMYGSMGMRMWTHVCGESGKQLSTVSAVGAVSTDAAAVVLAGAAHRPQ
jgi:hypothetical protein